MKLTLFIYHVVNGRKKLINTIKKEGQQAKQELLNCFIAYCDKTASSRRYEGYNYENSYTPNNINFNFKWKKDQYHLNYDTIYTYFFEGINNENI